MVMVDVENDDEHEQRKESGGWSGTGRIEISVGRFAMLIGRDARVRATIGCLARGRACLTHKHNIGRRTRTDDIPSIVSCPIALVAVTPHSRSTSTQQRDRRKRKMSGELIK